MEGRTVMPPERRMAIGAGKLGISFKAYRRHVEAGEKWCAACHRWHPRESFGKRATLVDGLDNICRLVMNARARARMARAREKLRRAS